MELKIIFNGIGTGSHDSMSENKGVHTFNYYRCNLWFDDELSAAVGFINRYRSPAIEIPQNVGIAKWPKIPFQRYAFNSETTELI